MTTRQTLPQNRTYVAAQNIETFQAATDWVTGNGTATGQSCTEDTTHFVTGTKSIRLQGTNGTIIYDKVVSIDLTNREEMELWLYVGCAIADISNILIYISNNPWSTASLATIAVSGANFLHTGWNCIKLGNPGPSGGTCGEWDLVSGSNTWGTITKIRIRVTTVADHTADISFGLLRSIKQHHAILMTFDDGWKEIYTQGFAYMNPLGLRGTMYLYTDWLDDAPHTAVTTNQVDEMYAAGWCIGNHTQSHVHLSSLSLADQITQIDGCTQVLRGKGWIRGIKHAASPWGEYNADTLSAYQTLGFETVRQTVSGYVSPSDNRLFELMCHTPSSLANTKLYIDRAIAKGAVLNILHHKPYNDISEELFKGICDHLVARRANVITMDEYYNSLTNPRYRSLPLTRAVA
jgi:peptidoglycan/xylan/chitin deacetylase (PgdA/CDA1 family)